MDCQWTATGACPLTCHCATSVMIASGAVVVPSSFCEVSSTAARIPGPAECTERNVGVVGIGPLATNRNARRGIARAGTGERGDERLYGHRVHKVERLVVVLERGLPRGRFL